MHWKVRLKEEGYAKYATREGTGLNTHLTTIIEVQMSVSTPTYYKVVATIAGNDDTVRGKFSTTFNNIKLDGVVPSNLDYQTPDEDYATVTQSGNSIKISIDRS